MKNALIFIALLLLGIAFRAFPQAGACTEAKASVVLLKSSQDTIHVPLERYLPIAQEKLNKHLRKARLYCNLALAMIPLNIITFGLAYLVGVVFAVLSGIEIFRIKKLLRKFPELEDNPDIATRLRNCYLRFCLLVLGFLGFVVGVILLISFIFFFPNNFLLVLFICALGLGLFFLMDWLVFGTRSLMR